MTKGTCPSAESRIVEECRFELDEIVRLGAQRMLQTALEAEVAEYIERHQEVLDSGGKRVVTRNGRSRERSILSGAGRLQVRQQHDSSRHRRYGWQHHGSDIPVFRRPQSVTSSR